MPKIYAVSDLHLSFGTDKPMHVFGERWRNYEEKLKENWEKKVLPEDIVLMCGDTSWALYLQDADKDFSFIHRLPGTKVITKGNHDYWWETLSKLNMFCERFGFSSVRFLHNTNFVVNNMVICGTKGYPETEHVPVDETEKKLYHRELGRLQMALQAAETTGAERKIVMLHYPPGTSTAFAELLQEYHADYCVFGHLHGGRHVHCAQGNIGGVEYRLTSSDYLGFDPLFICEV